MKTSVIAVVMVMLFLPAFSARSNDAVQMDDILMGFEEESPDSSPAQPEMSDIMDGFDDEPADDTRHLTAAESGSAKTFIFGRPMDWLRLVNKETAAGSSSRGSMHACSGWSINSPLRTTGGLGSTRPARRLTWLVSSTTPHRRHSSCPVPLVTSRVSSCRSSTVT